MELPPLIQKVIADVSGYTANLSKAADTLRGFGQVSAGIGTTLDVIKSKHRELGEAAREMAVQMRNISPATKEAINSVVADMERMRRAMDGPLAATRAQVIALKELQAATSRAGQSKLASDLASPSSLLQFGRLKVSSAQEAQYRFANQSVLENMIAGMQPDLKGIPFSFSPVGSMGGSAQAKSRMFGTGDLLGDRQMKDSIEAAKQKALQRAKIEDNLQDLRIRQAEAAKRADLRNKDVDEGDTKKGFWAGLEKRFASGFLTYHFAQQAIQGVQHGVETYAKVMIEGHKDMATSGLTGLHTASTALVTGIGQTIGGFIGALKQSVMGLIEGGPVKAQIEALGHVTEEFIGGIETILNGITQGAGQMAGGLISGMTRMISGKYQAAGAAGQSIGAGISLAGVASIGTPAGIPLIAVGQVISSVSSVVTGILSAQAEAAGAILGTAVQALSGIVSGLLGVAAQLLTKTVDFAAGLIAALVTAGMETQKLATTFGVLTGSAEQGRQMLTDIQNLSIITPFTQGQLAQASETLLQMGLRASEVKDTLSVLANVSLGDPTRLKLLTSLYGEIMGEGGVSSRRVRELAKQGVLPEDFAKQMGVTVAEVVKQSKSGTGLPISAFRGVLESLTSPGGRNFEESQKNLATVLGQWTRLGNVVQIAVGKMGEAFNKSSGFMEMFKSAGDWVGQNTDKLVNFAKVAGQYVGELARQFANVAVSVGEMIGGKLAGMDGSGAAAFAIKIRDAFLSVAEAIATAGAELLKFVSQILQVSTKIVGTLMSTMGKSLYKMVDDSWENNTFTENPIKKMIGPEGQKLLIGAAQRMIYQGDLLKTKGLPKDVMDALKGLEGGPGWVKEQAARIRAGLGGGGPGAPGSPDFVGPVKLPPLRLDQWEEEAANKLEAMRKLMGHGSVGDHLVGANLRGSQEAYETFAKSWADKMGPDTVEDILRQGLTIQEDERKLHEQELDALKNLPQDLKDKLGLGPVPMGINGPN